MVRYVKSKIFWLIVGGLCANLSCSLISRPAPTEAVNTIPTEVKQNIDTVTLEICIIPIAPHQNELLQQLWREADEQSLSPQLRRELFSQGFRVGFLGHAMSPALAQLLKVSPEDQMNSSWGHFQEVSVTDAVWEPTIARNLHVLFPEMRTKIKVFNDDAALPTLSLFENKNGMVSGQTYRDALGLIFVSASANGDGSAQIQIVPTLEHGDFEYRVRTLTGMVVQESGRPRHTFESLTLSQRFLPGQWLLIGMTALDSAGAGKAFFSRQDSVPEQRLLAIRFVHVTLASSRPLNGQPTTMR